MLPEALANNVVLVGTIGALMTGSLLWLFKAVPAAVGRALMRAVTVTVTINSDDKVFEWINDWLSSLRYTASARLLKISTHAEHARWAFAPGFGWHLIWRGLVPFLVRRTRHEGAAQAAVFGRLRESFTIVTFGRGQARLRDMLEEADRVRTRRDMLEVRLWQDDWWRPLARKQKRPLESVFLEHGMLEELVERAAWFFEAGDWHRQLGIPYRLGWLFEGIPGTGKTTAAMAIAAHFDRPLCILNLATVTNDNMLVAAFTRAEPNSVILIEDVDAVPVSNRRESVSVQLVEQAAPRGERSPAPSAPHITLSGLLNAIDGVASVDGRLLIMTTNMPEKLDPALVRAGRVDKTWRFGALSAASVDLMASRFYPGEHALAERMAEAARALMPMTASELQAFLLRGVANAASPPDVAPPTQLRLAPAEPARTGVNER